MTFFEILYKILKSDNVSVGGKCKDCEHLYECWAEELSEFHNCENYEERKVSVNGMDTGTTQTV